MKLFIWIQLVKITMKADCIYIFNPFEGYFVHEVQIVNDNKMELKQTLLYPAQLQKCDDTKVYCCVIVGKCCTLQMYMVHLWSVYGPTMVILTYLVK